MRAKVAMLAAVVLVVVAVPFYVKAAVTAGNFMWEKENATEWEKVLHAFQTGHEAWVALGLGVGAVVAFGVGVVGYFSRR